MEIKATDVRIGNVLQTKTGSQLIARCIDVHSTGKAYVNRFEVEDLRGIPLTEELLLKMGFSLINGDASFTMFVLKPNAYSIILCLNDMAKFDLKQGEWMCVATKTKLMYVHQLQNLYFALCGQELTLS